MHRTSIILALVIGLMALASQAFAQVPQLINYQGRITVGGVNYNGPGQFKFALVNGDGTTTFWSNDGTSTAGSEPALAVPLTVTTGNYSLQLGDTALTNMTAVPPTVFANADVRLRVWFNDGTNGSQMLTPDQRIASVGYAMMANTVPDGAITSAKIANGAVQSAQIATGAVGNTHLSAGAVTSSAIANGAVGSQQLSNGAVTVSKLGLGYAEGDVFDGTLSVSGLGLNTFETTYPAPFTRAPAVTLSPGWTLASSTLTGFSAQKTTPPPVVNPNRVVSPAANHPSLAVVHGFPAMSYHDTATGMLMYRRALDAQGSEWSAPLTVDSSPNAGTYSSLAMVNGRPAIAYYDGSAGLLKYARADDANGTLWTFASVVASGGEYASMTVVEGNPAIAFYSGGDLQFVRAANPDGGAWGTVRTLDSGAGQHLSLSIVNGKPAVSYQGPGQTELRYVRSTTTLGTIWSSPVTVAGATTAAKYTTLRELDHCPAVSYFDQTAGQLKFVRANDADGAVWPVPVVVDGSGGAFASMSVVSGTAVIAYQGGGVLKLTYAADPVGSAWAAGIVLDNDGDTGRDVSLANVNGAAAMAYHGFTNGSVKYYPLATLNWSASNGTVAPVLAAGVQDGAISAAQLATGAVGSSQIANQAVGTNQISYSGVGSLQLGDGAVTAKKLGLGYYTGNVFDGTFTASNGFSFPGAAPNLVFSFGHSEFSATYPVPFSGTPTVTLSQRWTLTESTPTGFTASGPTISPFVFTTAPTTNPMPSIAMVNGHPAVCFAETSTNHLVYRRALDATGTVWSSPVTLDSGFSAGLYCSIAIVNGNPAVSYYNASSPNSIKYIRANDADGSSWGTPVAVADGGMISNLVIVDGNPSIAYDGPVHLTFVRAADSNGTSWGTPVTVDAGDTGGLYAKLCVVNGKPAIAYEDSDRHELKFVRAQGITGFSWSTPVVIETDTPLGEIRDISLVIVAERPAVSFFDSAENKVKYARANDGDGATWPAAINVIGEDSGQGSSMAVVNGNPAISYGSTDGGKLKIVRATERTGAIWSAPTAIDSTSGILALETSLAEVNGAAAMAYFSYNMQGAKYAIMPSLDWTATDGTVAPLIAAGVANGAVGANQMADGSVTSSKLSDAAVTAAQLADGAVTTPKLADGAVTAAKIASNTITGQEIQPGSIGTAQLADGSITTAKLAGSSVTAQEIAPGAIAAGQLANGSVTAAKIAPGAVGNTQLADNSITGFKIASATITGQEIAADAVGNNHLAAGAVSTTKLEDQSVTLPKMAANSVGFPQLINNSIGTAKIADGAITGAKIGTGAIDSSHLAPAAVGAAALRLPGAHVRKVVDPEIAAVGLAPNEDHVVSFDTAEFNIGGVASTLTPTRLTAPVDGIYQVTYWARLGEDDGANGEWLVEVRLNGGPAVDYQVAESHDNPSDQVSILKLGGAIPVKLVAGDYIELLVRRSTSGVKLQAGDLSMMFVSSP